MVKAQAYLKAGKLEVLDDFCEGSVIGGQLLSTFLYRRLSAHSRSAWRLCHPKDTTKTGNPPLSPASNCGSTWGPPAGVVPETTGSLARDG